ncbi:MAG: FAD-dependent oxidoreductase, partial [Vicinamibacterales bacterium]|nr:FAD-dependent oxidoreductase [Vicinamibacterales bacterium]
MIDKNDKLDITIVGAGVIGCAVAYELGRCGAAVRVLESRDVGLGATQASAGVLAPYIEAHHPGPLRALGLRSLDMYDAFVADVVADSGKVVPYERTGTLEVATDDASLTRLEQTRQGLASAGVACRMLSQTEARVAEPHLGESVRGA